MAEAPTKPLALLVPPDASDDEEYAWLVEGQNSLSSDLGRELLLATSPLHEGETIGLFWHKSDPADMHRLSQRARSVRVTSGMPSIALLRSPDSTKQAANIRAEMAKAFEQLGLSGLTVVSRYYDDRSSFYAGIVSALLGLLSSGTNTSAAANASVQFDGDTGTPVVQEESIIVGGVSDHVATVDRLGFIPYVRAVAMFLRHKRTTPPFTMSIDGEWGSGKSSFMRQLQIELEEPATLKDKATWVGGKPNLPEGWKKPVTIWFNPWRHDKDESLWAAFALSCLREIPKHIGWLGRLQAYWRRLWRRLKKPAAFEGVLKTIGKYLVAAAACVALFLYSDELARLVADGQLADFLEQAFGGTALGASLLTVIRLWKLVEPVVKEPIAADLAQHLRAPDYASKVAYLEQFHEEFSDSIRDLAPDRDVYVFIDDLDRCEVPRAAELMQAINLLTAGDTPLYFIIGMDREKVAAGVAAKHKAVLDHLDGIKGLDFGYSFIQKFIQLPFRVPRPTGDQLEGMLDTVVEDSRTIAASAAARSPSTTAQVGTAGESTASIDDGGPVARQQQQDAPAVVRQRVVQIKDFEKDSDRIKKVIRLVAPYLDCNPRRVKQFAGLFRLQYYLAVETGLCDRDLVNEDHKSLSIEQIGKFTALVYLWPRLVERLDDRPELLSAWERHVTGDEQLTPEQLATVPPAVFDFLRAGLASNASSDLATKRPNEMYLGDVDVVRLLRVATPIAWEFASGGNRNSADVSDQSSVGTGDMHENMAAQQQIEPNSIGSDGSFGAPNVKQHPDYEEQQPKQQA